MLVRWQPFASLFSYVIGTLFFPFEMLIRYFA
jgi:hypothetical protein